MRTSARLVCVLVFDEFELLDLAGAMQVLTLAGRKWNFKAFKLYLAGVGADKASSRSQVDVLTHGSLSGCPPAEYLLVPGGYGARRLLDDDATMTLLKSRDVDNLCLCALGYGVLPLAKAGLLAKSQVVVPREVTELFRELEPTAQILDDRRVCFGERILTASSYLRSIDLGLELVARELGTRHALGLAAELGYSDYVARHQLANVRIIDDAQ